MRTCLLLRLAACLGIFAAADLRSEEKEEAKPVRAQSFHGNFLGIEIQAERLGVVLDISESMTRSLPTVQAALRKQLPNAPMLQVDGCALEKPEPRARIDGGTAADTATAVAALGKHAGVEAVLWICDMGDPPNRYGVVAMEEILAEHGVRLFVLSVKNKPGPSTRKLAIDSDGDWKVVNLND